jgi:hypothetical protein
VSFRFYCLFTPPLGNFQQYWTIWWCYTVHMWEAHTMLHMCTLFFHWWLILYLSFLGEADFIHTTRDPDPDHDASSSQRVIMRASDRGRVGEGVGKITYPRDKAHLLCNQVVSHRHPTLMVTLNTLPLTHPQPSTMCNGSMSGRIQNSISCWCSNGKQLQHGWDKVGRTTRQACW